MPAINFKEIMLKGVIPIYRISFGLRFSAANPLHNFILHKLGISRHKNTLPASVNTSANLNITTEIFKQELFDASLGDLDQTRKFLNEIYLVYSGIVFAKKRWVREDNILGKEAATRALGNDEDVASRLAALYYRFFEITLADLEKVLSEYFSQMGKPVMEVSLDFVDKITNTYVDNSRYPLKILLADTPDCRVFKSVVRDMQYKENPSEALALIKEDIHKSLGSYTSFWKFSLFGHHHNQRALAVKLAIHHCNSLDDLRGILLNQKNILEGKEASLKSSFIGERWTTSKSLVNKKKDYASSGFYQAIATALAGLPSQKVSRDKTKGLTATPT